MRFTESAAYPAFLFIVGVFCLFMFFKAETEAQEPALLTKGESFAIVWDCLPIPSSDACYMEILRATSNLHKDGWIDVVDKENHAWVINPARATAIQRAPKGSKAE